LSQWLILFSILHHYTGLAMVYLWYIINIIYTYGILFHGIPIQLCSILCIYTKYTYEMNMNRYIYAILLTFYNRIVHNCMLLCNGIPWVYWYNGIPWV